MSRRSWPRPRLRTVLLIVGAAIASLPLGGIALLRLYENEYVRRTEAALIAQGAFVRASSLAMWRAKYGGRLGDAGGALPAEWSPAVRPDAPLDPLPARLELGADAVLPPAPQAAPAEPADPVALELGERLTPVLIDAARTTLAGIRVTDAQGVVVASTRGELGLSLGNREEVAAALLGQPSRVLRRRVSDEEQPSLTSLSRGQRYRVFVVLPILAEEERRVLGTVVLSRTPLDLRKALWLHRRALVWGALGLVILVSAVMLLTSLTVTRPIRALVARSRLVVREGRVTRAPLAWPGTRELGELSDALTQMAETLHERADTMRTFASHVSHEFKTPLASIRGAVELLEEDHERMSAAERRRFLGNIDAAAVRLQRLVTRLAELARAGALRPGETRTPLADALRSAVMRQESAGRAPSLELTEPLPEVAVAFDVLAEVLGNLIDNARRHGGEDVHVVVRAHTGEGELAGMAVVEVEDDGVGIAEGDVERVFLPFFTTARETGGSGLGLPIVRALLESYGGAITLLPTETGTCFRLLLPASPR